MIHIRKDLIDAEMLKGKITIIGKASVEFFHAFRKLQIEEYLAKYNIPTNKLRPALPEGLSIPGVNQEINFDINFYFPKLKGKWENGKHIETVTETIFIYCDNISQEQFEIIWKHFDCRTVFNINVGPAKADRILQETFAFEDYISLLSQYGFKEQKDIAEKLDISKQLITELKSERQSVSVKLYKSIKEQFPLSPYEFLI